MNKEYKPIVVHKSNGSIYRYNQDNNFTNIATGVSGNIDENKAKDVFKINLDLVEITSKFPMVEKLIETLKLKLC
jgi:hypothetical protein